MKFTKPQQDFFDCHDVRCLFIGGRQSGKTATLLDKAEKYADTRNGRTAFVAPTERQLREIASNRTYKTIAGNEIHLLKGNEMGRASYEHYFVDEISFITATDFSLSHSTKSVHAALTPPLHWVSTDKWTTFHAPTRSNPHVNHSYIDKMLAQNEVEPSSLLEGIAHWGHTITRIDGKYSCVMCDMEAQPLNESALADLYALSSFKHETCN